MNNINNIIKAIESLGGSATIEEITKTLCRQKKIMFDPYLKNVVSMTLNNNSNLVNYSSLTRKWSLGPSVDVRYLFVAENKYFSTIRDAMYEIFGMRVNSGGAWFKVVGTDDYAWFPKFDNANPDWTNELSENGRIWKEKPNTQSATQVENDRHLENHLRYAFAFDKVGSRRMYRFTGVFKQISLEEDGTRIYEIVEDKVAYRNNNPLLVVCNISYMKYYKGITEEDKILGGGGKYPTENGDGGEKENFLPREDGYTYGFVETNYINSDNNLGNTAFAKTIHLENLNPNFKNSLSIDGVRVVFISKGPNNDKNIVVGWYDNATLFRTRQNVGEQFGYNIKCRNEDAHIIVEDDRSFSYPKKNADGTYNFGQQNISYPYASNQESTIKLANELNQYIDSFGSLPNFYYEPVNLTQLNMFEKVEGLGHIEYFLATKSMKVGDYILCHVGTQVSQYEPGIYAIARILGNPEIYKGNTDDYCYDKLSVRTEIIKFSDEVLLPHHKYCKYDTTFRSVHRLDSRHSKELFDLFELNR